MRTNQKSLRINRSLKSDRKLTDEEFENILHAVSDAFDQVLYEVEKKVNTSPLNGNQHYINLEIKELIPEKIFTNEEKLIGPDIVIPDGYTQISSYVFNGRKDIVNVKLPDSITIIRRLAFCNCINLEQINIPDSVLEIHEAVFKGCESLSEIKIPAGVISIDGSVFNGCTSLQNIYVDADNTLYADVDGVLYNKNKTKLLRYPEGKSQSTFVVPVTVREIAYNAFKGCDHIKSLHFPAG